MSGYRGVLILRVSVERSEGEITPDLPNVCARLSEGNTEVRDALIRAIDLTLPTGSITRVGRLRASWEAK